MVRTPRTLFARNAPADDTIGRLAPVFPACRRPAQFGGADRTGRRYPRRRGFDHRMAARGMPGPPATFGGGAAMAARDGKTKAAPAAAEARPRGHFRIHGPPQDRGHRRHRRRRQAGPTQRRRLLGGLPARRNGGAANSRAGRRNGACHRRRGPGRASAKRGRRDRGQCFRKGPDMTEESVILEFVKTAREKRESLDEAVTEDAAAIAFAERYGSRLRFDHDVGRWFVWSGQHWQGETTDLAFSYARELARELAKGHAHKARLASSKTGFAAGVERFARSDRAFAVTSAIWDRNTYLLGTPGGTVDLRNGYLMPAQATDYITKLAAVTPAETAHCPRWRRFLQDATGGDAALV